MLIGFLHMLELPSKLLHLDLIKICLVLFLNMCSFVQILNIFFLPLFIFELELISFADL